MYPPGADTQVGPYEPLRALRLIVSGDGVAPRRAPTCELSRKCRVRHEYFFA